MHCRYLFQNNATRRLIMVERVGPGAGKKPAAAGKKAAASIDESRGEWDVVAEASWESFPASDPPAWISRARSGADRGDAAGHASPAAATGRVRRDPLRR
jgi:hypothetical protein